ncbi:peptidase U32 [Desulfobulbus propionicus DSM 2032]|uniref:Peptidase U32 n=1 Tax=Desulfobulbus propionicus (strain ATCC 33891 / DSM 2032 / VKM B-1956 / 1pr3) TaxID=577650 RepID=A0A7U3YIU4_DESPD|nr:U32 family peptidase [Desulfobulbus propionicus]ADW16221.1 peptidase U32 [Desulfobulbus propionicus DSM 2032]
MPPFPPATDRGPRLPELLAPAGSFDKLVTAVHYGADAVYLGGKTFSLRARAGNFDEDGLRQAVAYAHAHGVKVYVTVNIFAHNRDLEGLEPYLRMLRDLQADGLIVSDPGILALARRIVPDLPLHLSTQANVTNRASARFWAEQGVCRLNLARELGLEEIRAIRAATGVELEVFVHGALCISYSGRCMLSNYFTGRNANLGDCAHPCRYSYAVVEEKRPGHYFPVEEDERGTYIFNSRDLCLLHHLPSLVDAGVDAIKIEGRMKSVGYVGAVVRLYRLALEWIREQLLSGQPAVSLTLPEAFDNELSKIGTRGQTENFFRARPSSADMLYDRMRFEQKFVPVGIVRAVEPLLIETRHVLNCGDHIEYLGPSIEPDTVTVSAMHLEDGTPMSRANPGNLVVVRTDPPLRHVEPHALLRKHL